ncbi:MAG TPA: response regulator [Candidatus Dormibacteraeota bacterium]
MAAVADSPREIDYPGVARWVLIVDPDRLNESLARSILERAGFGVAVVSSVAEAIDSLAIMTPALIVVDDLPGASDLLDRARAVGIDTARHRDLVSEKLP